MEILSRSYYAKKIDSWLGSGLIIVLIGQRRVGKSYVMKDFIARHEKEADANIIYIDKEKRSFRFISNCDEVFHDITLAYSSLSDEYYNQSAA